MVGSDSLDRSGPPLSEGPWNGSARSNREYYTIDSRWRRKLADDVSLERVHETDAAICRDGSKTRTPITCSLKRWRWPSGHQCACAPLPRPQSHNPDGGPQLHTCLPYARLSHALSPGLLFRIRCRPVDCRIRQRNAAFDAGAAALALPPLVARKVLMPVRCGRRVPSVSRESCRRRCDSTSVRCPPMFFSITKGTVLLCLRISEYRLVSRNRVLRFLYPPESFHGSPVALRRSYHLTVAGRQVLQLPLVGSDAR